MSSSTLSTRDRLEIRTVIGRYVLIVDNGAWEHADEVFAAEATFGGTRPGEAPPLGEVIEGWDAMVAARPLPLFPHQTTDIVLHEIAPGVVRAWSKFFTVRPDSLTSGDYLDTLVREPDGAWRIRERLVSLGDRPDDDPFGPSRREFTLASWRASPDPAPSQGADHAR